MKIDWEQLREYIAFKFGWVWTALFIIVSYFIVGGSTILHNERLAD